MTRISTIKNKQMKGEQAAAKHTHRRNIPKHIVKLMLNHIAKHMPNHIAKLIVKLILNHRKKKNLQKKNLKIPQRKKDQ